MSFCLNCLAEFKDASWSDFFSDSLLCPKCYESFQPDFREFRFDGGRAYSLYPYNETFRNALYRFKGCSDIALAPVFLCKTAFFLRIFFKGRLLVPAPSHALDDEERGFNHVEEAFRLLHLPTEKLLVKTERIKQAGSPLDVRKGVGKRMGIVSPEKAKGKKILFVDDVMTSGSTAMAAASLLRGAGAKSVDFLFLSKVARKGQETSLNRDFGP